MSWSLLDALVCPGWKGKEAEGFRAEVGLPELLSLTEQGHAGRRYWLIQNWAAELGTPYLRA